MRIISLFVMLIFLGIIGCTNNKNDIEMAKDRIDRPIVDFSSFDYNTGLNNFSNDKKKNDALIFFKEWAGTPYLWGGDTKIGIDCSAFIQKMYRFVFNINLPRTTREQMKLGEICGYDDLAFGDLVFFKTGITTYHVGFYYENGLFFNSSSSKGVSLGNLNDKYWKDRYLKTIRIARN